MIIFKQIELIIIIRQKGVETNENKESKEDEQVAAEDQKT